MAGADGDAPGAAAERMRRRAQRVSDLSPVMRELAVDFAQQTAAALRAERSPSGETWDRLANSTIARRAAKLRGANRRSKKSIAEKTGLARGKLTKKARATRADAISRYAAGGNGIFKALYDTGRLAQSIAYTPRANGIEITAVWYLAFHVTGSLTVRNRPPKRNPLVVQHAPNGAGFALIPSAHSQWLRAITDHVEARKALAA